MKNFDKLTDKEKVVKLLNMAFDYPMEHKYLPLSKLWSIDKTISEKIHNETEGNFTQHHYNQVIMNNLLDYLKKDLVEQN